MKRRMLCIVLAVLTAVGSLAGVSLAASNTVPILVGYADVDYMADEILKTIPTGAKTDEERIGAVYDWVVTNCSRNGGDGTEYFDEAAVEREAALYASAAETRTAKGQAAVRKELESWLGIKRNYGGFVPYDSNMYLATFARSIMLTRTGNCAHFSALLAVLLGHLGYDCRLIDGDFINGDGSRTEHKWNYVLAGGKYYWLDSRMDNASYARTGTASRYYFMVEDTAAWEEDHSWQREYSDALAANAGKIVQLYGGPLTGDEPSYAKPWEACSQWAVQYMEKADAAGLIPDELLGKDLTKEITREEFAAAAVKLYEALAGRSLPGAAGSPFSDTDSASVGKAWQAGIVKGVGEGRFDPASPLTREQASTMLGRVYELWKYGAVGDGEQLQSGVSAASGFSDDGQISAWAASYIRFFVKTGVINGMGDGTFAPRRSMTREAALKIAVETLGIN